jgi:hypothetical protein
VNDLRSPPASTTPAVLTALAAVALATALAVSSGLLELRALGLVTAAAGAAFAAARVGLATEPASRTRAPAVALALGIAGSLVHDFVFLPGATVDPARLGAFRPVLVAAGIVLASLAWRRAPGWLVLGRFPVLVLLATALGAIVILASPAPGIDVWQYQQRGALALLSGHNPYGIRYRNPYGPGTPLIAPSLLTADGRFVLANPYPPLSLLAVAPAAALGDVRWAMLAAVAAAAFLVWRLGRGSLEAELAAALLLLQPQAFLVLELAWTEPLALSVLLLAILAARRTTTPGAGRLAWLPAGLAAGLAAASKQYVPLLLLPLLPVLPTEIRIRAAAVAVGAVLAVMLPFVAWDPGGFWRSVVEFQVRQPFRADALSWPAAIVALGGPPLPSWPAFLLAGLALAATMRRTLTPAQAVLSGASAWLAFVAFNKQAFCNYYWLAVGLLCAAVALLCPAGREGPPPASRRLAGEPADPPRQGARDEARGSPA